jgi:two-component system phosphate regulon sensor histidine kinase PhoR
MRKQGPITMRHMIVAVLVVVVINAQLTWWIVFILGLNRENLDLERRRLQSAAQVEAARIETEIKTAHTALEAALVMGDEPGRDAVPPPFIGWRAPNEGADCPAARLNQSGVIELGVAVRGRCVSGVVNNEWRQRVMDVGDELVVTASGDDGPEGVRISEPFDGLTVRPRTEVWQEMLEEYRRRIIMMVSEGSFFALLLLVLMALLWRSFRREVELERQHRNFLSAITHELKSPLAAMRLALETVTAGRASGDTAKRFLGNALDDADRLEDLVQKVLEATRYGDNWSEIDLHNVDFSGLVEESVQVFSRRALAAGVHLEARIAPDIYAELDREAMAIAVSNLLENAVKYGGESPMVEIDLVFGGSDAVLEVSDNGRGILEEEKELIFGRFYRSGDEMTRTTGGTGLGLYLVQQIVEAHRGRVVVAATGSDGTTFRVTLPGHEE